MWSVKIVSPSVPFPPLPTPVMTHYSKQAFRISSIPLAYTGEPQSLSVRLTFFGAK